MPHSTDTQAERSREASADATLLGTAYVDAAREPAALAREPTRLGRYRVVRRVGAGAMGSVYEGRDVDLDRPVALKLVRADLSAGARQRMHREALALARLSHPNVVQIHEIGQTDDGRTFIAMELVRGRTLEQWQHGLPRPGWRQVLRCYAQAGEGLAAAHAEGLVHRDFKPQNCMLGDDGRVRVLDFGLAKHADDEPDQVTLASGEADGPVLPLTRTGAVVGTPAYMPPEQLGRGAVDATADQFSFCVALYEALYGERPFAGDTLAELVYAVTDGRVRPPPREAAVPGWVRKVVLRGLVADPGARWPAMRALLDALADDPAVRRRRRLGAAGVVVLLGAGALGVVALVRQAAQQCQGAEAKLEGAWDPARRAAVEQAILGTALPYAPQTWERVQAHLDGYAGEWVVMHVAACEATRQGEQSGALLDLRMACLDERRLHLRALVDELSRADPTTVEQAVQAALALPRLARCEDAEALLADERPPEDPAVAERVAELDARLVEARAKRAAGKRGDAMALVEAVVAEAEPLGYEPLRVRAWLSLGGLQDAEGRYEAAKATLERAYDAAVAHRMIEQAADASTRLVWVVGRRLGRYEDAWRWAVDADPLSRASRSEITRAKYLNEEGTLAFSQGDHARARKAYEAELAIEERLLGPDHYSLASTLFNLGNVAHDEGDYAEARACYERALTIEERVLGPEHPDVARSYVSLGNLADSEGQYAKARTSIEHGLALLTRALGPDHPDVARTLVNLSNAMESEGQSGPAHALREQALAGLERALGPTHPEVALALNGLAESARKQGDPAKAITHLERALAIQREALGPKHPHVANTLHNLGVAADAQGDHATAREHLERALAIEEAVLGPEHPDVAGVLDDLSASMFAAGDPGRARVLLERALAIKEAALGADHPAVAITVENLGILAHESGAHAEARDRFARALALHERALGPEHPRLVLPLAGLGRSLVELSRPAEAIAHLERALALGTTHDADPALLTAARFTLARALWDVSVAEGRDRARARALAGLARTGFVADGEASAADLAEVDAWLAAHREP